MTTGVLLVNLGSPDAPTVPAVRRYLDEFLMDRHVIDVPWLLRRLIVSGTILPFRPKHSAAAYAAIWRSDGSPLILHTRAFGDALAAVTGMPIAVSMRYGEPSIDRGLTSLLERGVRRVLLFALYPHHADSTRTTTIEFVRQRLKHLDTRVSLTVMPAFYDRADYIDALAAVCRSHLPADLDLLLFSYHGIPERQVVRADPTGAHCLKRTECCESASPAHTTCYRHQTRVTSTLVARALGIEEGRYMVSYQSRLGRLPWLAPYTDELLAAAPARGWRRIAVVCPAFVADNLETLEEIGIRGRAQFLAAGGESFTLVPCLNDDPEWVGAAAAWCNSLSAALSGLTVPGT